MHRRIRRASTVRRVSLIVGLSRGVHHFQLIAAYTAGDSVEQLAERFGVHRTTVIAHLDRRKIERRTAPTAWDHAALTAAAASYVSGESLAAVAARFGVDPSTVANRFRRAGIAIRPRRGWIYPPRTVDAQEGEPTTDSSITHCPNC